MAEKTNKIDEKKASAKAAAKPEAAVKKRPEEIKYESLVRIYGYDMPGTKSIYVGLTKIKGISWAVANVLLRRMNLDHNIKVSDLSKEQIGKIEKALETLNVPDFMKNRRNDPETGKTEHLIGTDLEMRKDFDIKKLKKIKSYVGIRHSLKQPVRGQRTRSHFRAKGRAVIASKRKAAE